MHEMYMGGNDHVVRSGFRLYRSTCGVFPHVVSARLGCMFSFVLCPFDVYCCTFFYVWCRTFLIYTSVPFSCVVPYL